MKVNPLKVLVTDITEVTQQTKGGILIPTNVVKVETMQGKVAIAGKGTAEIDVVWKEGDTVLFNPRSGQKVKYDNKEYRLLDVNEILLGGV